MTHTLQQLAADLRAGTTTSCALVEACLARAQDPQGEGARSFVQLDAEGARRSAAAVDAARAAGADLPPLAGIPLSVKDLFDVQGQVTTAGSVVLRDATPAAPATQDALAVARLKATGMVVIGRTNMTEFAYSGLGINPHYGTPANVFDRAARRIPGGSSSGAAISVTDGMAAAALGSDTGGSCRIPAALNGLVGYKPTAEQVPLDGAFALSPSLDSVGPIARSVQCCVDLHGVLRGRAVQLQDRPLTELRLGVVQTVVLDGMDDAVAQAYAQALTRLGQAGVQLADLSIAALAELAGANARGGIVAAEALAAHRERLARQGAAYDPRVRVRMEKALAQAPGEYAQLLQFRKSWGQAVLSAMSGVDFLVCPTVPVVAPLIRDMDDEDAYGRTNLAMLRNPTFANFLDGCSISLPCQRPGEAPVGLMLIGRHGADDQLLSVAQQLEPLLR